MRPALLVLLLVCSCRPAWAQMPFLKKILFPGVTDNFFPQGIRQTPNGEWLLTLNSDDSGNAFTGFVRLDAAFQVLDARAVETPNGREHRVLDLLELPDGHLLCFLQFDSDALSGSVRPRYFIKKYTPALQEVWSLYLGDRWQAPLDYPRLLLDGQGNLYGACRKGFTGAGAQTHLIFKVSDSGSLLWSFVFDQYPTSLVQDNTGNLLLSLAPTAGGEGSKLLRLHPASGAILEVRRFPNVFIRDINLFPGGDVLLSGRTDGLQPDKVLLRLRPDLSISNAWRVPNFSLNSEQRNVLIRSDELLYYFINPPGGERGRVILRLDGQCAVQKAVLLPEAGDPATYPQAAGPDGLVLPTWFSEAGAPVSTLLRLDTALALPGCAALPYCAATAPFTTSVLPSTMTFTPNQTASFQASVTWAVKQAALTDLCPGYTPPGAYFSLPDTVCPGVVVVPDSLRQASAGAWQWQFEGGRPASSLLERPSVQFDQPGLYQVRQRIWYLGCRTDSFSRQIFVHPAPVVELGAPDTTLCAGDSLLLAPLLLGAGQWVWDDGSGDTQRRISSEGLYWLRADNGVCNAADSIAAAFQTVSAGFTAPDSLCVGMPVAVLPSDADPAVQHDWQVTPDPGGVAFSPASWQPDAPGLYHIRHVARRGACADTAGRALRVLPTPVVDLGAESRTVCRDSAVLLIPHIEAATHWAWSDGVPEAARRVEAPGWYRLEAGNGVCAAHDSVLVAVVDCPLAYIPNVFSPNGDGQNDFFEIFWNERVDALELLEIYDRWGGLVFRSEQAAVWDGQGVAPGVYVCRVVLRLADGSRRALVRDVLRR